MGIKDPLLSERHGQSWHGQRRRKRRSGPRLGRRRRGSRRGRSRRGPRCGRRSRGHRRGRRRRGPRRGRRRRCESSEGNQDEEDRRRELSGARSS